MIKREINAFISKYLDESGKPFEALTEFRHYNVDLINKDKDKIIEFFSNIYNFSDKMSFKDFKTSKDEEELYHLEMLFDLDEFEDLIGFLFASDILIDSLITRAEIMGYLGSNTKFLIRDYNDGDNYTEQEYVSYLDKYILPIHIFEVNKKVINKQKESSKKVETKTSTSYTQNEMKEMLGYWFHQNNLASSFTNYFDTLLEENFNEILTYAVMMEIANVDGPATLVLNIITHHQMDLLKEVNEKYTSLPQEYLKEFEQEKAKLFKRISKEMQEKNRHL